MKLMSESKKELSVNEAGRRGGNSTLKRKGKSFFRRIGSKGGKRTAQLYRHLLKEFGQKGGRPKSPALGGDAGEGQSK
jgi:general stress protein YciG